MCRLISPPFLALYLALVFSLSAADPVGPKVTPILEPEKQGAELAARLRSPAPNAESKFTGSLVVTTRDDKITSIPLNSVTVPGSSNWTVIYNASAIAAQPGERLTIRYMPRGSNSYSHAAETNSRSSEVVMQPVPTGELTRPFGRSDFWLCDLGLEFLHWPRQRVLRHEMRRSRSCWVLESVTLSPLPGGYARVVSWVDVEYEGILRAEAYDKAGKLMKEFTLGSMRKIDGRYQLESMKMRNVRTGQESEIKFDLPREQDGGR